MASASAIKPTLTIYKKRPNAISLGEFIREINGFRLQLPNNTIVPPDDSIPIEIGWGFEMDAESGAGSRFEPNPMIQAPVPILCHLTQIGLILVNASEDPVVLMRGTIIGTLEVKVRIYIFTVTFM